MATTEKPPSRIDGKPNPAYTKWYREQQKKPAQGERTGNVGTLTIEAHPDPVPAALTDELVAKVLDSLGEQKPIFEDPPEGATRTDLSAWIEGEDFQSAAEPEQTTNDDPREPEVAPALEAPSEVLSLLVIREARNSKFVLCALDRKKVAVRLLKRGTGPKLVKKHIKVRLDRKQYLQVP